MNEADLIAACRRVERAVRRSEWVARLKPGDQVAGINGGPAIGTVLRIERRGSLTYLSVDHASRFGFVESREIGWYGPVTE